MTEVHLQVFSDKSAIDDLASLEKTLISVEEFRGRTRSVAHPPAADRLGSLPDVLVLALANGTAVLLASTAVSWIRHRTHDIRLLITRKGDETSVELTAERLRGLGQEEIGALIHRTGRALEQERPRTAHEDPGHGP
ncbi:effector-associated constant component EACC1 [Nocardiopsis flavescens]